MIKVKGIDHLNMRVENLEESLAFYQEILGLEVKEEGESSGRKYAIIGAPRVGYFCQYQAQQDGSWDADGQSAPGLSHFGLFVDHFDQMVEELKSAGIELLYGGVIDYGKSRSVYIQDPSGLEIELSERFGGGLN